MQVPYDQGLANQIGPAVCAHVREGMGEASPRGSVGWVLSRESALRCADPVGKWGRQHGRGRTLWRVPRPVSRGHRPQARTDARRAEGARFAATHGNREISRLAAGTLPSVRVGEADEVVGPGPRSGMMHAQAEPSSTAREKSDPLINQ